MATQFMGYLRPDGRVGIRNHVAILSVMDNTNPTAHRIANIVNGTVAISTPFGRGQFGYDRDMTYKTLAGLATHPNIAAVLVLSLSMETAPQYRCGFGVKFEHGNSSIFIGAD
jgi:altronate dehydratase large subunit